MKNRIFLPVVVLLAAGFFMLGCPTDTPDPAPAGGDDLWDPGYVVNEVKDLSSTITSLTMASNFQYDRGYQGLINWASLFDGTGVAQNEVYELEIEATVSRDMEGDLRWVIVNRSPPSYWTELTRTKFVGLDDAEEAPETDNEDRDTSKMADPVGPVYDEGVPFTSINRALVKGTSNTGTNTDGGPLLVLSFGSDGEGTYQGGSSAYAAGQGPFTITFTKFIITRLKWSGDDDGGDDDDDDDDDGDE